MLCDNTEIYRMITKRVTTFCLDREPKHPGIMFTSTQIKHVASMTSCHHLLWHVIWSKQHSTGQWPAARCEGYFWGERCHHGQALTCSKEAKSREILKQARTGLVSQVEPIHGCNLTAH